MIRAIPLGDVQLIECFAVTCQPGEQHRQVYARLRISRVILQSLGVSLFSQRVFPFAIISPPKIVAGLGVRRRNLQCLTERLLCIGESGFLYVSPSHVRLGVGLWSTKL